MAKTVSCRDVGMDCDFVAKGETTEDIMQQAAEHARTAHNNQNGGAMLISGAADPDNSRSVLPPGVSCRGGTEEWANPTVANSPSLMSSVSVCFSCQQPIYRLAKLPADCQQNPCAWFFFSPFQS